MQISGYGDRCKLGPCWGGRCVAPFFQRNSALLRLTVRHSKVVSTARQELAKRESEKLHDGLPFRENSLSNVQDERRRLSGDKSVPNGGKEVMMSHNARLAGVLLDIPLIFRQHTINLLHSCDSPLQRG